MISLIGSDIRNELLIVYSLIGLVIALIIIILIIDKVGNKKKDNLFKNTNSIKGFDRLENENNDIQEIETSILEDNQEELVPISDIQVDEVLLDEFLDQDVYVEDDIEKTQAQIEVEEITRLLVEAQKEERIDPYKQFEEEQELNAIISYEELQENFDRLYDENEKVQYVDDDKLPIDLNELYQKNEEILNPKKVKLDDLNTVKVDIKPVVKKEEKTVTTGFRSSPVISPVYGIQKENSQSFNNSSTSDIDDEIKRTNEFLRTLKELQKNLD